MSSTMIAPGLYPDFNFDDYLSHSSWGSSSIKDFRNCTAAYAKWRRENRSDSTPATRLGSAAHCAILTPDLFQEQFVVKPEGMEFRSKENKAIRDGWIADGKEILTSDEWNTVENIVKAFHSKAAASRSLAAAVHKEASVFWDCTESGLGRKCRPDWFTADTIFDLKISIEATKPVDRLTHCVHANGWLNQLAGGRAGLNANGFNIKQGALVVIASQPPHEARVWLLRLKEADCDFLELENENTCRSIAQCERTGVWPGTPDDWIDIELPMSATWTELDAEGVEEVL